MTALDEIRNLYAYHRWANGRILGAAGALTEAELDTDAGGSFGSLRSTLAHMIGADHIWLSRWQGTSPPGFPAWDVSTFDALRARWRDVESAQTGFIEALTPADLTRPVTYRNMAGTEFADGLDATLRHVVNHATYHRGQVTALLRILGHPSVPTDLILFHRERTRG